MQFDDSKSGDHLETTPDKPPAVVANIPERQGVTGHNVRYVLFFRTRRRHHRVWLNPRQLFRLNQFELGIERVAFI
jgi:hypothetical protein